MSVEDVTEGVPPGNSVRLRGTLIAPAAEAYDLLAERLQLLGRTPLLRREPGGARDEVMALPVTLSRPKPRVALAAILFGLTILSCLFVGAQMSPEAGQLGILAGWPFAGTLLAILGAHELGHYIAAHRLGSPTSLPYFIPLPFGPFGTLGAFITMPAPPRNRRHLLVIGAAGPLAGLALALPLLWIGLSMSQVMPLPDGPYQMEGNSLLYAAIKLLQFGMLLPSGSADVFLHPVAFAAWAGLMVTGLNLIPAGQLDGGHIVYALVGRTWATRITWGVIIALAALCFVWTGWIVWLALLLVFGRFQGVPLDDLTELTGPQRRLGVVMLLVFVLVFTPIPLTFVP